MAKTPATKSSVPALQTAGAPPAELAGFMDQDAGRGVSQNANDVGIPFLAILQDLSPQVKKRDEAYIEGAEVGMLLNNQLKKVYDGDEGLPFIPCFFKSAMVQWGANRSGWIAEHPMDTPLTRNVRIGEKKERLLPDGSSLDETKYYYGFYLDPESGWEAAVVGMAKSMLGCSRDWQGMMRRVKTPGGVTAPSFSKVYTLRSKLVNKNNQEWYKWDISEARWVTGDEYAAARTLAEQCENGAIRASVPDETGTSGNPHAEEVL